MSIGGLRVLREPPCTEPYARWCGSWGRVTAPSYPMSATLVFRAVLWPESIVPNVPSGPPCGGRSRAAVHLVERELLTGRVLDYGCGFGFDADHFGWDGYDLFYRPENPVGPYDTILCNLVLNALSRNRRAEVLENILRLLAENGRAYLTVARNLPPTGKLGVHHSVQSYVVLTLPSIFVDESIEILRDVQTSGASRQNQGLRESVGIVPGPAETRSDRVRILAHKSWMETSAVDQLEAVSRLPGVELAVGFPDLHPGKGAPIGAAVVTRETLYPHLAGNDIGCGMALFETEIPKGKLKLDRWEKKLRGLEAPWEGDAGEWLAEHGVTPRLSAPSVAAITSRSFNSSKKW